MATDSSALNPSEQKILLAILQQQDAAKPSDEDIFNGQLPGLTSTAQLQPLGPPVQEQKKKPGIIRGLMGQAISHGMQGMSQMQGGGMPGGMGGGGGQGGADVLGGGGGGMDWMKLVQGKGSSPVSDVSTPAPSASNRYGSMQASPFSTGMAGETPQVAGNAAGGMSSMSGMGMGGMYGAIGKAASETGGILGGGPSAEEAKLDPGGGYLGAIPPGTFTQLGSNAGPYGAAAGAVADMALAAAVGKARAKRIYEAEREKKQAQAGRNAAIAASNRNAMEQEAISRMFNIGR